MSRIQAEKRSVSRGPRRRTAVPRMAIVAGMGGTTAMRRAQPGQARTRRELLGLYMAGVCVWLGSSGGWVAKAMPS